jgi:hypothetical protein
VQGAYSRVIWRSRGAEPAKTAPRLLLLAGLVLAVVAVVILASAVLAYRAIALWVPAILGSAAFVSLRRTLRRESAEIAVCAPHTEMEVIGLGRVVIGPPTATRP